MPCRDALSSFRACLGLAALGSDLLAVGLLGSGLLGSGLRGVLPLRAVWPVWRLLESGVPVGPLSLFRDAPVVCRHLAGLSLPTDAGESLGLAMADRLDALVLALLESVPGLLPTPCETACRGGSGLDAARQAASGGSSRLGTQPGGPELERRLRRAPRSPCDPRSLAAHSRTAPRAPRYFAVDRQARESSIHRAATSGPPETDRSPGSKIPAATISLALLLEPTPHRRLAVGLQNAGPESACPATERSC